MSALWLVVIILTFISYRYDKKSFPRISHRFSCFYFSRVVNQQHYLVITNIHSKIHKGKNYSKEKYFVRLLCNELQISYRIYLSLVHLTKWRQEELEWQDWSRWMMGNGLYKTGRRRVRNQVIIQTGKISPNWRLDKHWKM